MRFCQCHGCPACGTTSGSHGTLYDADTTGTLRCPGCQAHATARRNARTPRAQRGYDAAHDRKRRELLAAFRAGDPCALCHEPMVSSEGLDLAHNENRDGWKGLAHARCNRGHHGE